jgi:hypothetical protein
MFVHFFFFVLDSSSFGDSWCYVVPFNQCFAETRVFRSMSEIKCDNSYRSEAALELGIIQLPHSANIQKSPLYALTEEREDFSAIGLWDVSGAR